FVVDRPEQLGQQALGSESAVESAASPSGSSLQAAAPLWRSAYFWCLVYSAGLITCGGIVIVSHLVPFATGRGIAASSAARLLSINGGCGMFGALLFGWVADRIGARITVGLIGVIQALMWSTMLAFPTFGVLALVLVGIGLCGGGLQPAFAALLGSTY